MGGPGSGNRMRFGSKFTTGERCSLDVRHLAKEGALRPGYTGLWRWTRDGQAMASIQLQTEQSRLIFTYRHGGVSGEWKNEHCLVRIAHTRCNLGGSRAWFLCPTVDCGRRVALLYSGDTFVCRHCSRLVYASQREDAAQRAASQADKIRTQLGWQPGILNPSGDIPKGMHRQTFFRLQRRIESLTRESLRLWTPPA